MKPTAEEDARVAPCRWEDCGEMIACDRGSVNKHMRKHLKDLQTRELLHSSGAATQVKGMAAINKCQTHCRWRDEIPCPYSDLYQSQRHKTMLKTRKHYMQKLLGRRSKKSEWARNAHFPKSDVTGEELDSEEVAKAGQSRGQCNGSLISVQSLIKHICATHLHCLMMTCEDCSESFSRTDAYVRHRKEVHGGESRTKMH